jgi:hypothetical protein
MKSIVARLIIGYFSVIAMSLIFIMLVDAKIDPESIAGLWIFNEGSGKVTEDSSGNGYDGELKGNPTWTDGKYNAGLEFHGGNYVELRDSAAGLPFGGVEPFSVTAWVKNQGGGTIIGKFNGGIIGAYIVIVSGGGTVTFHREVAPWGLAGTKALPDDEFGHVAATYDGSEMKIYINGELDSKQDRGAQNTDTVTPVLIGARFTGGNPSDFFTGVLDEVALFNIALSQDDIKVAMRGLSPESAVFHTDKVTTTWARVRSGKY